MYRAWPFRRNHINENSNSCALVIRLRTEKRVVAITRLKFVYKNLSFQGVFTDVYDGSLDVHVKCKVGFKKPGDAEPKDFVSIDLAENVGTIVNALDTNFVIYRCSRRRTTGKSCQAIVN